MLYRTVIYQGSSALALNALCYTLVNETRMNEVQISKVIVWFESIFHPTISLQAAMAQTKHSSQNLYGYTLA